MRSSAAINMMPRHLRNKLVEVLYHRVYMPMRMRKHSSDDPLLSVIQQDNVIIIRKQPDSPSKPIREVILPQQHLGYARDVKQSFDFYFSAVVPEMRGNVAVADFSKPDWHRTPDFAEPIFFTGLAEPMSSVQQYIDLLSLKPGQIVIDAGAYCGLSTVVFANIVGKTGKVIAIEPDQGSFAALMKNIARQNVGDIVIPFEACLWNTDGSQFFDMEGNLGSAVNDVLIGRSGNVKRVRSITMQTLINESGVKKVDALKIDIEGAEYTILDTIDDILAHHKPMIVMEPHKFNGKMRIDLLMEKLARMGYQGEVIDQSGIAYPLIKAWPK